MPIYTHSVPHLSRNTGNYVLDSVSRDRYKNDRGHPDQPERKLNAQWGTPSGAIQLTRWENRDPRKEGYRFFLYLTKHKKDYPSLKGVAWHPEEVQATATSMKTGKATFSGGAESCIMVGVGGEGHGPHWCTFHIRPQNKHRTRGLERYLKAIKKLKLKPKAALHGGIVRQDSIECAEEIIAVLNKYKADIEFNETCENRDPRDIANHMEGIKGSPLGVHSPNGYHIQFYKEIIVMPYQEEQEEPGIQEMVDAMAGSSLQPLA
jgi:hypothetical protein